MMKFNEREWERLVQLLSMLEEERLSQLEDDYACSEEYQSLSLEQQKIYEQLSDKLPQELQDLLLQYDELYNDMEASQETYYYRKGFMDAVFLLSLFKDEGRLLQFLRRDTREKGV